MAAVKARLSRDGLGNVLQHYAFSDAQVIDWDQLHPPAAVRQGSGLQLRNPFADRPPDHPDPLCRRRARRANRRAARRAAGSQFATRALPACSHASTQLLPLSIS